MEFTVLRASGADGGRWRDLIDRLEPAMRDLHFLPEYIRIYEKSHAAEGRLACYGDGDRYVIQPFMVRRLNGLPFLAEAGVQEPYFDIASAYGYGGPAWRAPSPAAAGQLFAAYDRTFTDYCRSHRFASEFCCLHPLLENHAIAAHSPSIALRIEKSVVKIDLTLSESALWRQLSKGHRSGISKARRSGVKIVRVPPDAANLAIFARLYFATMDRHHAVSKWYFRDTYFADCVTELTPQRVALFFAEADGGVAAAGLVLHDEKVAYYHFAGSDERYFSLRPTNCMVYEAALWAKRAGKLCYHLGGGVTAAEDDKLLRFKTGFGGKLAPLYVYGRVHDERAYRKLCQLKHEYEKMTAGRIQSDEYFPRYRQ